MISGHKGYWQQRDLNPWTVVLDLGYALTDLLNSSIGKIRLALLILPTYPRNDACLYRNEFSSHKPLRKG